MNLSMPDVFNPSFDFTPLRTLPEGAAAARILTAALREVDPYAAVARVLQRDGSILRVNGCLYDISAMRRVLVIGAGKAALPMAQAALDALRHASPSGLLITKDGHGSGSLGRVEVCQASHPVPDERGLAHTRRLLGMLQGLTPADLVIALVSGGASALLTAPVPGVSLADLRRLTDLLLRSGADIGQVNTVRKHLDAVKGGGLARACFPAQVAALVLSDVLGDPLESIASGPLAPDAGTFEDAWQILENFNLLAETPAGILAHLQAGRQGKVPETARVGDPVFDKVQSCVVAGNLAAARAARDQAGREGYHALLLTSYLQGEASQAGIFLAALARQMHTPVPPLPTPACFILGGETTVSVRGNGRGGRNQELALGAVPGLAGLADTLLVTLATDGGDGPTDAAGAFVSGGTLAAARAAGLDVRDALKRNDAYTFFDALGGLLRTGPTRTNVNDLALLMVGGRD